MKTEDAILISAADVDDLTIQLNDAEQQLQGQAMRRCDRGILVTRLSPSEFRAELHPSVPFGLTIERC